MNRNWYRDVVASGVLESVRRMRETFSEHKEPDEIFLASGIIYFHSNYSTKLQ